MKRLLCIILLLLTITLVCCKSEDETLNQDTQDDLQQRYQVAAYTDDDICLGIICFDVNYRGDVAIGMKDTTHNRGYVSVYNKTGERLYGYTFGNVYGTFYVEWKTASLINIYWVRSDVCGTYDAQANCIEVTRYTLDSSMNKHLNRLKSTERWVAGTRYYLKASLDFLTALSTSYSRVISIMPEGLETVIVDMNGADIPGLLFLLAIFLLAFIVIKVIFFRKGVLYETLNEYRIEHGYGPL